MLGFVQNFLAPRANPIGVDFGSDCLRLLQVQQIHNDHKVIAAASAEIPAAIRHDPQARLGFFARNVRELLGHGNFRGRQAVLSLPASVMQIQQIRLAKLDEQALKKAIPEEARGRMHLEPSQALLRHIVAGEIHHYTETQIEVIVMAAARQWVNDFLAVAAKARLDVIGMNIEPMAIVDCFSHVYRRKSDQDITQCFVDIGASGTRAIIARGSQILFARNIPVGGEHFTRATSNTLSISMEDARTLRVKLAALGEAQQRAIGESQELLATAPARVAKPSALFEGDPQMPSAPASDASDSEPRDSCREDSAAIPSLQSQDAAASVAIMEPPDSPDGSAHGDHKTSEHATPALATQATQVMNACRSTIYRLASKLIQCREYHENAFPKMPIDRLIFIGGEARQRAVCQEVAKLICLPAQLGDPMCRMARTSDLGIESGLDRRAPQPAWTVAIGLSMGPPSHKADPTHS